ncbi:PIG-L family deacetylase [Acuticoccus sp. MNP-M23]|uniref:PIG-L deacetylase family protein n=1 Tax=Acuticoccus sp. MNP-M23 TaxID=3072793 RepID=UPI002815ECEC|nr:PIG-L family deacetylase [Acuticoccus sp. MNP-M23]WMS44795.1 PIG-L family deacetylase [Acuticoccus sp. MNP-M23]
MSVPQAPAGVLLDHAAAAPVVTVDALMAPGGAVLVIAPHPDDETFGCGAAIAHALAAGRHVAIALLTDGDGSHPASREYPPARLAALRRAEFAAAVAALGAGIIVRHFGLPDTGVPSAGQPFRRAATAIKAFAREVGAGTIWCTWRHDPHCDHQAAAALADMVEAQLGEGTLRRDYAVWGRFGEAGDALAGSVARIEAGPFAGAKAEAIACHRSQVTALIADDPGGFVMPPALVAHFAAHDEIFVAEGPDR